MAKFRQIKNTLLGGEIAPNALGRTDLPIYPHSCETLLNMIPTTTGGAYRRPGTQQVGPEISAVYSTRLIPFVSALNESFFISIRIFDDGHDHSTFYYLATNASAHLGWTGAVGTTITNQSDVANNYYRLSYSSTKSAIGYYDEINNIQFCQSADTMWLVCPTRKPRKLTKTGVGPSSSFSMDTFDSGTTSATVNYLPFRPQNTTGITITPSATTGNITLTASANLFDSLGASSIVGTVFKFNHSGTIGYAKATGYTSATQVSATVIKTLGGTGAVATWWESSWNNYRGWPRTVAIYQNRLVYGGNAAQPDTIWFSASNDYNTFSVDAIVDPVSSPTGTQPFEKSLASTGLNHIQWLVPGKTLIVGTSSEEWIVSPDSTGVLGADSILASPESRIGSLYTMAVKQGNEIIFQTRTGSLKNLIFSFEEQSYTSEDIQSLYTEFPYSEKVIDGKTNNKIAYMAWDESRKTLWLLDTAGNFRGLTRDRKMGVNAWHRHQLGGYDADIIETPKTISGNSLLDPSHSLPVGAITSFCLLSNNITGYNDINFAAHRIDIDNVITYNYERLIGSGVRQESVKDYILGLPGNYFTDCSMYYTNDLGNAYQDYEQYFVTVNTKPPVGNFTCVANSAENGLINLGELDIIKTTVTVPLNPDVDYYHFDVADVNPPSVLTNAYSITFGYNFDSVIKTTRIEAGSQIGTAQGAPKMIHKVTTRFYKTMSAKVGRDESNLEEIIFRPTSTPLNESHDMITGDKQVDLDSNFDNDGYVYILQDKPLPFTVLSVVAEGVTYD